VSSAHAADIFVVDDVVDFARDDDDAVLVGESDVPRALCRRVSVTSIAVDSSLLFCACIAERIDFRGISFDDCWLQLDKFSTRLESQRGESRTDRVQYERDRASFRGG